MKLGDEIGQAKTNVTNSLIDQQFLAGIIGIKEYDDNSVIGWTVFQHDVSYIYAFDLTDLESPFLITESSKTINDTISSSSLLLDDGRGLMTIGTEIGEIKFIDISNPYNTSFVGGFLSKNNTSILSMGYTYPFMSVCHVDGTIVIYNATTITEDDIGIYVTDVIGGANCSYGMVVEESNMYISTTTDMIVSYNISSSGILTFVSSTAIINISGTLGSIARHPDESILYLSSISSSDMTSIDISDITNMTQSSTIFDSGSFPQYETGSMSFVEGAMMFIINKEGEMMNYCVSGPSAFHPVKLSEDIDTTYSGDISKSVVRKDDATNIITSFFSVQYETPSIGSPTPSIRARNIGLCGDGIIQAGEQCDPPVGVEHSPDFFCCDDKTCDFKTNSTVCFGEDDSICTVVVSKCTGYSQECTSPVYDEFGKSCENDDRFCSVSECDGYGVCKTVNEDNCIINQISYDPSN